MKLHELKKEERNINRKRVGRGISAGGGKTAGRGTKGQNSRSGHNIPRKFEGGQTPIFMRLHKLKGFKSLKSEVQVITLDEISKNFKNGDTVSIQTLTQKGMIKKGQRAKILNSGELKIAVKIDGVAASKSVLAFLETKSKTAKPARSASSSADAGGPAEAEKPKST